MKSRLFIITIATTAALLLNGCAKDELLTDNPTDGKDVLKDNGTPVAFETTVSLFDADTRAEITSKADLATSHFGVFAYYHDGSGTTDGAYNSSSSAPNFMYNQEVESADAGVTWTYAPIKYWPNETKTDPESTSISEHIDKLSFLAYAPFATTLSGTEPGIYAITSSTTAGDAKVSYRVSTHDPAKAVDLMWGVNPTTGDPLLNLTKTAIGEKVNIKFYHALTKLDVEAQLAVDQLTGGGSLDANTKVFIEGLYLIPQETDASKQLGIEGYFNLNTPYSATSTGGWTVTTPYDETAATSSTIKIKDAMKYGAAGATGVTTNSGESALDGPLMFIPINGTASYKYNVKLVYHVVTTDPVTGMVSDVTNDIVQEVSIPFLQAHAYKLIAIIGLTSVKFTVEVVDWTLDNKPVAMRSTDEVF